MSNYPTQFPEFLKQAERDGEGGIAAEPPGLTRGEAISFVLPMPADEEFDDWTDGAFTAVLRAAPGATGDPLASYTCVTGTPSGNVTPVTLSLPVAAQSSLPPVDVGSGLTEVFLSVRFTPTGGTPKTLIATRQLIKGAI